ncbi:FAD-dependent oxidoreductase [Marinobacter sp. M216]|uniref:FAD-dependent oxidoreductase n=1 Tax=Marinobacter albus TaxID=3030833 RepID=A0ABT7HBS6_9GAMM|nr:MULTISPECIES: FAD-dependent oxidoreductase [unclassified Marinobacter]MBW7469922.1 FAD-dependent oxidoreductase [Marinobacter sp. F4218]MDK9557818.1 FAD-dependent oxidoreductase [Marinobacter sp. M216]
MFNQPSQSTHIRRIAVVGSGLSGLTAGLKLKRQGHDVTVFEKSRGPGGRLAAKRVQGGSADVGAQYFTARNPAFLPFLQEFAGDSAFAEWQGRFAFRNERGEWDSFPDEPRYVGSPRMTAISRALSAHLQVVAETRVEALEKVGRRWSLTDTEGTALGEFDQVVITAPPAQTRTLLVDSNLGELAAKLDEPVKKVLPCWAVAAHFEHAPSAAYEGMRVEHPVLYWVANNSSKPGREDSGQWWVLHANPEWTEQHVETPAADVAQLMVDAFRELVGSAGEPDKVVTHRWLYARSADSEQPGHLWFADQNIGIAGDWLSGGRVEGAFNSACSLVAAMSEDD